MLKGGLTDEELKVALENWHLTYTNQSKSDSLLSKIVSEYDQEIPQSQTADNPMAPRGRAAQYTLSI